MSDAFPDRGRVLGYPLDALTLAQASQRVVELAFGGDGALVVTLNPEIVVRGERESRLREAISAADLCVADGVGIVWAARRAGLRVPERVPGVELAASAMRLGGPALRVFFLGGRPGVAARAAENAADRYGVTIAGARDGYFGDEETGVVERIRDSKAHLLLAGLGERQEVFLWEHRHALGTGAAMGVGGTLDVLAGDVRRTPAWTRRAGIEWAWRVGSDPKRWHRAPRLARFVRLVLTRR